MTNRRNPRPRTTAKRLPMTPRQAEEWQPSERLVIILSVAVIALAVYGASALGDFLLRRWF